MDAKPAPVFESADEEIRLLESLQQRGRVRAAEDTVAELGRDLAEHARPEEKPAAFGVQRAEDLLVQVLGNESVVAPELADGTVGIRDTAQPEKREIERAGPALGPFAQDLYLVGIERQAAAFDEELVGLGELERELPCSQLGQARRSHAAARASEPGRHGSA